MKRISDGFILAGVLLFCYFWWEFQGDAEVGRPPEGEWRWELLIGAAALVTVGWRLYLWQAIGDWRAWWQIPREERPEYHRRLDEAMRRDRR